jgi:ketosteroid isomerase-like protein
MAATTTPTFDIEAMSRAIEQRDAATQLAMFADDAEVVQYDKDHPPASPDTARGKEEIGKVLEDVFSRDMKHRVFGAVVNGDRAAYGIECEYPDGNRVACAALLDLRDGRIVRQVGLQAWDG